MLFLLKTLFTIVALMATGLVLFRYALAPGYRGIVTGKLAVLAFLTPLVALFCGNVFIFCAYLAATVALNSRSRAELAATYAFLLPLTPILSVEVGFAGFYLIGVSAVAGMGLGALMGFAVTRGRKSLAQPRFDVAMLLLIGLFVFIYNRDTSVTAVLRGLAVNVIGFAGPYLLVSRGLEAREDVVRLLLRLALGAVVTAVTACFQAVKHWTVFEAYYQTLNVPFPFLSWNVAMRAGFLRTGGSMLDYSSAGLFFASILALMPMLRIHFRTVGFWAVTAVLAGGLFATQSRGAWVAAVVGLLFVAAYRGLWGRAALLAGTVAVAGAAVTLVAPSGRLASMVGTTGEASGTATYRQQLLSQGMDQVRANPLLGQSPDHLIGNLPDLVQGQHIVDFVNAHLYVAMTAGVPLFLVWCYIWLGPVVEAWRRRSRRFNGGDLMEAPAAIIVPVMVALVATSIIDRNLIWPTIALGLAGPCVALTRKRAVPKGAPQTSIASGSVIRPQEAVMTA
ncbi:O-antigen ligase family protein [uncultured Sphingomonas sp.]|uniref:O-antigen ligase family protein n=1 Tax=uncultured Sphingomonas sp. TaxID=158754 RepID=UPI0035C9DE47